MEININNAFYMAIKFSWAPYYSCYGTLKDGTKILTDKTVIFLLQRPAFTIFIVSIVLLFFVPVIFVSLLLFSVASLVFFFLLIIEGLAIISVLSFITAIFSLITFLFVFVNLKNTHE